MKPTTMGLGLAVLAWSGTACRDATSPATSLAASDEVAPPPVANARAMFDEARRELADPERVPVRQGMDIDEEQLRQALLALRAQHGAPLAVAYQAELDALPEHEPPTAPRFREVATFSLPAEPSSRDAEAINWVLDADVHGTVQRVLGTYLTIMMHRDLMMAPVDIGIWMAFLRAAKPELRRCSEAGSPALKLCLDYGADVFVLDMEREEPAWVVTRLTWMQL